MKRFCECQKSKKIKTKKKLSPIFSGVCTLCAIALAQYWWCTLAQRGRSLWYSPDAALMLGGEYRNKHSLITQNHYVHHPQLQWHSTSRQHDIDSNNIRIVIFTDSIDLQAGIGCNTGAESRSSISTCTSVHGRFSYVGGGQARAAIWEREGRRKREKKWSRRCQRGIIDGIDIDFQEQDNNHVRCRDTCIPLTLTAEFGQEPTQLK